MKVLQLSKMRNSVPVNDWFADLEKPAEENYFVHHLPVLYTYDINTTPVQVQVQVWSIPGTGYYTIWTQWQT